MCIKTLFYCISFINRTTSTRTSCWPVERWMKTRWYWIETLIHHQSYLQCWRNPREHQLTFIFHANCTDQTGNGSDSLGCRQQLFIRCLTVSDLHTLFNEYSCQSLLRDSAADGPRRHIDEPNLTWVQSNGASRPLLWPFDSSLFNLVTESCRGASWRGPGVRCNYVFPCINQCSYGEINQCFIWSQSESITADVMAEKKKKKYVYACSFFTFFLCDGIFFWLNCSLLIKIRHPFVWDVDRPGIMTRSSSPVCTSCVEESQADVSGKLTSWASAPPFDLSAESSACLFDPFMKCWGAFGGLGVGQKVLRASGRRSKKNPQTCFNINRSWIVIFMWSSTRSRSWRKDSHWLLAQVNYKKWRKHVNLWGFIKRLDDQRPSGLVGFLRLHRLPSLKPTVFWVSFSWQNHLQLTSRSGAGWIWV